ncbi:MAG: 50S ribosomal protein L17 [Deltaproteobacteria bacterium]|nr:50S ribosomal protein L17 [Deltaproteobacteria bacterium]
MRHLKDGRKFGRNPSHRQAMFRNLAMNLIIRERIVTTDAKAKELRRIADKLVTVAKRAEPALAKDSRKLKQELREQRLSVYRQLRSFLPWDHFTEDGQGTDPVGKLMDEITPRFKGRHGGYTRIMKLGRRTGDNAPMSVIEWIPDTSEKTEKKKAEKEGVVKRASKFFKRSKKETAD